MVRDALQAPPAEQTINPTASHRVGFGELPVIIAAVEASIRAVGGETFIGLGRWLPLIGVFDALFLVICPWVFSFVVEE